MSYKPLMAASVIALASSALAAEAATTLRIQNHHSPESVLGQLISEFVTDVETMSNNELDIEMYYSSAVVASAETFSAAANGILDCDMTNGSYQTGLNPAFQFVADTMGGYDNPEEWIAWLHYGGGREMVNALYEQHGMHFVSGHVGGQESLNSTRPLAGVADLDGFKFRSPPGMESEIFAALGASPIVMDFTEIFTALETGIIDGADASTLAANEDLGIYEIAKHTTYPGFHSMSADHLACNLDVWNGLSDQHKTILSTAGDALAMKAIALTRVNNGEALASLPGQGVKIYNWSEDDRAAFRKAAIGRWDVWADRSPEAKNLVESHKAFLQRIGLGSN